MIIVTQHTKANSKAAIQHWVTAMAWLGIPKQIKMDNGTNFVSKSVQEFATKWNITLKQGIPYNSTGQAIVERANQTLKSKLETLGSGYHGLGVLTSDSEKPAVPKDKRKSSLVFFNGTRNADPNCGGRE
ncbi:endogenous retrovirus group K member 18 Pol protein-like protein [Turdus rufiventris]|nr:endogenous retrovirus group K member 18 Pol protein-like protein [Turdus rufiventris]